MNFKNVSKHTYRRVHWWLRHRSSSSLLNENVKTKKYLRTRKILIHHWRRHRITMIRWLSIDCILWIRCIWRHGGEIGHLGRKRIRNRRHGCWNRIHWLLLVWLILGFRFFLFVFFMIFLFITNLLFCGLECF